jgi:hypothetical protein
MLADRGDLDGLRALTNDGQWWVVEPLAELLTQREDVDGLRLRPC